MSQSLHEENLFKAVAQRFKLTCPWLFLMIGVLPLMGDERPNFLVILSDDQGWADSGAFGSVDLDTPAIDRLAATGIQFDQAYVTAPMCGPSRAGLLTGIYQQRYGFHRNLPNEDEISRHPGCGIPVEIPLISELLEDVGYRNGIFGKWHLGMSERQHPVRRGFHTFYGHLQGHHTYYLDQGENHIMRDLELVGHEPRYLTTALADECISFLREQEEGKPWFVYLSFNAPHTPMEAPTEFEAPDGIQSELRQTYFGMMAEMDRSIGRVLRVVERMGFDKNTLVIFLSDNGGPEEENGSDNGIFRGRKGRPWEGGTRTPMIWSWPAQLPAGAHFKSVVSALDIAPTLAELAGVSEGACLHLEGRNIFPAVKYGDELEERTLYWYDSYYLGVRKGSWKIAKFRNLPLELFNLDEDPGESNPLNDQYPEKLAELQSELDAWSSKLPEKRWDYYGGYFGDDIPPLDIAALMESLRQQ